MPVGDGTSVLFNCTSERAYPIPIFEWYKNDKLIQRYRLNIVFFFFFLMEFLFLFLLVQSVLVITIKQVYKAFQVHLF
jgi:hypothetical protein